MKRAWRRVSSRWPAARSWLPTASTNDLQLSPNGSYILAATHGRGLWKIATP